MLTLDYEIALVQRYVSEMLWRTAREEEGSELLAACKKCYNLRSQVKYRRQQIEQHEQSVLWAKAQGDPDEAEKHERRVALLKGEIFVRCSEINMIWHHEFMKVDEEVEARKANGLPAP
jgi:hypothetical protein